MTKFWVTTLAGVDFVVGEIASQRDFEIYLETGTDRGETGFMKYKDAYQADSRQRIKEMMDARNTRLDDLCMACKRRNADSILSLEERMQMKSATPYMA